MTNVIKFQSPFERLKLYALSPDISLFKAIITQAIIDATNISDLKEAKKHEIEAKEWLFGGSDYFKQVCNSAGMEPSFVVRVTKQLMTIHKNQPSKGDKKFINKKKIKKLKFYFNKIISIHETYSHIILLCLDKPYSPLSN